MAEQAPFQASSTFPNPPNFLWRDFTPDKLSRYEEAKTSYLDAHPEATTSKSVIQIPDLPEDLRHLQPPSEPADGTWRVLGGLWVVGPSLFRHSSSPPKPKLIPLSPQLKDELPTLEESGIQRLGRPSGDANRERALNLKRLAKSALLNFLELVGVASINPDGVAEKADDIETILINMHTGINEYRPHQARESLIQTMQDRLDKIRAETAAVNAVTDKAKRVLEGLGSIDAPVASGQADGGAVVNGGGKERAAVEDGEGLWAEADDFV